MVIIKIDFAMHVGRKRLSRLKAFTFFHSRPVSPLGGRRFAFHPTHFLIIWAGVGGLPEQPIVSNYRQKNTQLEELGI
jgi:hypothetical protein